MLVIAALDFDLKINIYIFLRFLCFCLNTVSGIKIKDMTGKGTSIIFINDRREILLLLRDNNPCIPFPNMWDLPGGHVEEGETPEACIVREKAPNWMLFYRG